MEYLNHAWSVLLEVFASGVLWKVVLFAVIFLVLRGAYRIQHQRDVDVDFFDLIRDFNLPNHPVSLVKTFFAVGSALTSVIYVLACTRPAATIGDIITFTLAYGSLWTGAQIGNKLAERPAVPSTVVLPTPPVTINNQPTDGSGTKEGR